MSIAAMETILNSATCRGVFRLNGNEIEPLKGGTASLGEEAQRTRNLWARVDAMVSDSGLMIAKKQDALSVASAKGGIILETSGPMNIGMLRVAVQDEARISPNAEDPTEIIQQPGATAVWTLARWIERVETRRAMMLSSDNDCWAVWAEKGRFSLESDQTCDGLVSALLKAGKNGQPIELTYAEWDTSAPTPSLEPASLFRRSSEDGSDWLVFEEGCLAALPEECSLEHAEAATALAQQLSAWCAGHPFEVAVFGEGAGRSVVARADTSDRILLNKTALNWAE